MKNRKLEVIETIKVCECYVPALYYGDLSGFDENEVREVSKMIEYIGTKTIDIIEGSENFSTCDISGLKGNTVEINILDWITE